MATKTKPQFERFAECIGVLAEAFQKQITPITIRAYQLALSDVPIEQVEKAALRAMRENKFFPAAAELRQIALGTTADRAIVAWERVLQAASDHSAYRHVDFDDGLINATIRSLGGWPQFVDRLVGDQEQWARKEFLEAYRALLASGADERDCRPLAGLSTGSVLPDGSQGPPRIARVETGLPLLPGYSRRDAAQVESSPSKRIGLELRKVPTE